MDRGKIEEVPIGTCFVSLFNTRKTRDAQQVQKLAERIKRFGFEETRALWVRRLNSKCEVFAGSMRLEAAKLVGVKNVPVVPYVCTDEEMAFLTEYDNENDEYHTPVPVVDVWAEYARLKGLGWTQERIAKAKGLKTHTLVSERLRLHTASDKVKSFVTDKLLTEENLREIVTLSLSDNLSSWLTVSQCWDELAEKAVYDRGKDGSQAPETASERDRG